MDNYVVDITLSVAAIAGAIYLSSKVTKIAFQQQINSRKETLVFTIRINRAAQQVSNLVVNRIKLFSYFSPLSGIGLKKPHANNS